MDIFLPEGFEPRRSRAPKSSPARARKLSVEVGGVHYPVSRRWATGFVTTAADVPILKGLVDLYDGSQFLHQCLITGREGIDGQQVYTFKRAAGIEYTLAARTQQGGQADYSQS